MVLFNTLGRRKEEFKPLDGKVAKIYSCGPTVYSSPSIGNMRAYIFVDTLKKALEYCGFGVLDVMNVTDVGHLQSDADDGEDKMEVSARKHKISPQDIAKRYTDEFFSFCDKLNIRRPNIVAPATQFIDKMIEHNKELEKRGFAYRTSDGLYFDSSRFKNYYALSKKKPVGDKAGLRVSIGEKKNANDFCLWRVTPKTALQKWDSPWGVGVPGWHIECSAIARACLGDTIDIHTGGVDHIPIHHTNEIAQSESVTGKRFARFWLHNEFIMIDGGKMSKSLGNVYTVADVEARGFSPLSFRYLVLKAHYRSIVNFTWESLKAAQIAYGNLVKELARHSGPISTMMMHPVEQYRAEFRKHIEDDLNMPKALAFVWELVKHAPHRDIYDLVIEFDQILSLGLESAVAEHAKNAEKHVKSTKIPVVIKKIADARMDAKARKDWVAADKLREEIKVLGYEIIDTKDGYEVRQV